MTDAAPTPRTDAEERKQMEAFGVVDDNSFARTLERETVELANTVLALKAQDEIHWKTRRSLLAENEKLREAAQYALDHVLELREAWSRGCISEHDGNSGTRSNRNVEAEQRLRAALSAEDRHDD